MYPNDPDLMQLFPDAKELMVAKLAEGGVIMTDNCDTARLFRRLFQEHIIEVPLNKESALTRFIFMRQTACITFETHGLVMF